MKIEHWHSQAPGKYPAEQLIYANLLAACMGNEGQPRRLQHCDTQKGDEDLSRNPATPEHAIEKWIRFEGDGRISSHDQGFDRELNEVLNLNAPFLRNNRKELLDGFLAGIGKHKELQRSTLEKWLREWNGESDTGDLREHCQVIVYWLRKRLARL